MALSIRPLGGAFGAEATGIDLRQPVAEADRDALNRALVDNVVLVIRDQQFTPQEYMAAARTFGVPMDQHYSQFNMPDLPQLSVLSSRDLERDANGKVMLRGTECWHTDHTNRERPPKITMLYAVRMPSKGGDTSFADMRAAYSDLPDDIKRRVEGMKTVNTLDRHARPLDEDREKYAEGHVHPMVRTHPESGAKALYFHPTKTERIVGMEPDESRAFVDDLLARIIRPGIVYRHKWRVGDMLLCDNRQALHQAHADYDPDEGRLVYRIILEATGPADPMSGDLAYGAGTLPPGIRSRFVDGVNGLRMHVLEAGFEHADRPAVLLLHGFPELAYSWRKVMSPLAAAGFRVIAPDQRGYGRTTGWNGDYDGDLASFRMTSLLRDTLGLVSALGLRSVEAVVGHDFGASVAAWAALVRPDVFRRCALMSAPFSGPPALPFGTADAPAAPPPAGPTIHEALAALPRPRKHYQWYYATREANDDMWKCPQGVHAFLRGYFHHKSADWKQNSPHPLAAWTAEELAKLPTYYVMERDKDMAQTVAEEMPGAAEIAGCGWLTEAELAVYSGEYARTRFQGGLNWYRARLAPALEAELQVFSGRTIDIPAVFISGRQDWGVHQRPGAFEKMQREACTRMAGCHLIEGAGHWVQQEQPERVAGLLLDFLAGR